MAAIPVSSLLGSPLSGLMLQMDSFGVEGWRWVFILQGLVPILAGFATLFFLPDRPEKAAWLRPEERAWLLAELEEEKARRATHAPAGWATHAGVVLLLTAYYFCMNVTSYGLSMFMPSIIKSQSGLSDTWASVVAALPYLFGLLGMLLNGWHSDRRRERVFHVALPLVCLGVEHRAGGVLRRGLGLVAADHGLPGRYVHVLPPAGVLADPDDLPGRCRGRLGDRVHQHDRQPGRVGGADHGRQGGPGASVVRPALYRLAVFPVTAAAIMLLMGYLRRGALRQAKGHH